MYNKVKIDIFAEPMKLLGGGCGHSHSGGCGGCGNKEQGDKGCSKGCGGSNGSGCGCSGKTNKAKSSLESFNELREYIELSDVSNKVELNFYDLTRINVLDYDDIRILTEMEYEAPFVAIDGIVRYYGGIPKEYIYKDSKELLE